MILSEKEQAYRARVLLYINNLRNEIRILTKHRDKWKRRCKQMERIAERNRLLTEENRRLTNHLNEMRGLLSFGLFR